MPVTKAGTMVAEGADDIAIAQRPRYVSRGGDKLAGAMAAFSVPIEGRSAADIGASTGGFTDFLLKHGAKSVVAVDVGYGQLAWSLRNDPRVTVHERTNVRHVDPDVLGAPFGLVVVDVSFISLRTILPVLQRLIGDEGDIIALVKPQFEAGKGKVGKRGVVRDADTHREVLEQVVSAVGEHGLVVRGITFSPITGPEGNIEFWIWASRDGEPLGSGVAEVVAAAHERLRG